MIPNRSQVQVDSTVKGDKVAMSIDAAATVHIMNVVTDLYADPELACTREYSTNALDSHVEAGQTRPIEVSTPTDLRPIFSVRDYGLGLTYDDIEQIYSRYGASTKRGSNDAVGMLGLGCKSALSYTDQFTVVGIVNGQRIVVLVSRDETGAGSMTVMPDSGPTDEPDGVEVQIPARRDNDFEAKARAFFAHWEPGTVLLNGEPPAPLDGLEFADGFSLVARDAYADRLTVVMGNVPYPAPDGYKHDALNALPSDTGAVIRVPIGSVQFAPSREALQDHPATRRALDSALDTFAALLRTYAADTIAGADSKPAAASAYLALRERAGVQAVKGIQWRGLDVPDKIDAQGERMEYAKGHRQYGWSVGNSYKRDSIELIIAGRAVWILDYTNTQWTATQRRKMDRYAEAHDLIPEDAAAVHEYIIYQGARVPNADWLDGAVTSVDWETVKKWRDPDQVRATGGGGNGATAGTYPVRWTADGYEVAKEPADNLPTDDSLLYGTSEDTYWTQTQAAPDNPVVKLNANRVAKFRRLFPEARSVDDAAKDNAERWLAGLSALQLDALRLYVAGDRTYRTLLPKLDPDRVDDPALAHMIRAARTWASVVDDWNRYSYWVSAPDALASDEPSSDYPLLDQINVYDIGRLDNDVILYVNAVYAADKGGN